MASMVQVHAVYDAIRRYGTAVDSIMREFHCPRRPWGRITLVWLAFASFERHSPQTRAPCLRRPLTFAKPKKEMINTYLGDFLLMSDVRARCNDSSSDFQSCPIACFSNIHSLFVIRNASLR